MAIPIDDDQEPVHELQVSLAQVMSINLPPPQ